jgi:signal transduction histidine kinase
MKLSTKIIVPFFVVLVMLVITFMYLLMYVNQTQKRIESEIRTTTYVNNLSNRITRLRQQTQVSLLSYRINKEDKYLSIIERNQTIVTRLLNEIHPYVTSSTGRELLTNFENSRESLQEARSTFITAIQSDNNQEIQKNFNIWEIRSDNSAAALLDFTNYNFQSVERSELLYKDLIVKIYAVAILLTLGTAACILALFLYMRRIITKPIQKLSLAAKRISQGDFNTKLVVRSQDELGDLARSLDLMSDNLKQYYKNLELQVKAKENELIRTKEFEKQKDNFMSIASHELKTPVTSLKVFINLMQRQADKNGHTEYHRYLERTDEQVHRLTGLVESLLDITKIQRGKMPYTMGLFDMNECLRDTIEIARETDKQHQILLKGSAKKKIYGDKDRICQVIDNFISNAQKYSPERKDITITVTNNEQDVTVSVRDHGIGIETKHLDKIFDRFFRVADDKETTYPGLGIGLYVSAEIIKRHGGKIWAESTKGHGSIFSFSLPVTLKHSAEKTGNGHLPKLTTKKVRN